MSWLESRSFSWRPSRCPTRIRTSASTRGRRMARFSSRTRIAITERSSGGALFRVIGSRRPRYNDWGNFMAVTIKSTRKVVVIGWDLDTVHGPHASIQVEGEEKRNTENDGAANLYFPTNFTGDVEITVAGSKEGTDSGTIKVR